MKHPIKYYISIRQLINKVLIVFLSLALLIGCSKKEASPIDPNPTPPEVEDNYKIHSIYELNLAAEALDSHAGEEAYSVLEMDYSTSSIVSKEILGVNDPQYARIKKTAAGTYLLFYQNASIGSNSYVARASEDLEWEDGELLFEQKPITVEGSPDSRRYSNCDAVVLSNGDILAVASFRANQGYRYYPAYNGIAIRRSTDNGITWGGEQIIYSGTNWEPYILELPNGDLHCYFTDADPSLNSQGDSYNNSGTSMVLSTDGGATWQPSGVSNNYHVFRQYKYDNEDQRIYTDQMPVVRMLNDGHSLVGIVEARMESGPNDNNSTYYISLVYGEDSWDYLTGDEVGPTDRATNLFQGAGGYITQFPSGETLISCNISRKFSMKLGDHQGRVFNQDSWSTNWYQPFSKTGAWGSLALSGTHEVLGVMTCSDGVQIARFILNHRIDAPNSQITLDGKHADWTGDQALFLGSASDIQTVFRASHDASHFYILAERKDAMLISGDNIDIYLDASDGTSLSAHALRIQVGPDGLLNCYRYNNGNWQVTTENVEVENTLVGTVDDGSADKGYVTEIAVPLSALGTVNGELMMSAVVANKVGASTTEDGFSQVIANEPRTWRKVKLKN